MIKTENLSMVFTTEEVQTKALNEVTLHTLYVWAEYYLETDTNLTGGKYSWQK